MHERMRALLSINVRIALTTGQNDLICSSGLAIAGSQRPRRSAVIFARSVIVEGYAPRLPGHLH
jgi:hypothetical protein